MDEHEQQYHHDGEQQQQRVEGPPSQADGVFARINGGMMQSGKFMDQIVSLMGQVTAHDTIRSADGSSVQVITEHLFTNNDEEGGDGGGGDGLIVDPNMCVEIMGQVSSPTTITVRLCCVVTLRYVTLRYVCCDFLLWCVVLCWLAFLF